MNLEKAIRCVLVGALLCVASCVMSCDSTAKPYAQLAAIRSLAIPTIKVGIENVDTPFRCQAFTDAFSVALLDGLQGSRSQKVMTLSDLVQHPAYRAISLPSYTNWAYSPGQKDLSAADSATIRGIRRDLGVDALVLVTVEYALVELYLISQEYRSRITVRAKVVTIDVNAPIAEFELTDDADVSIGIVLAFQKTLFMSPTKSQWMDLMNVEAGRMEKRARKLASLVSQEILTGSSVARGTSKPDVTLLARTSRWGGFWEWSAAWAALKLHLAATLAMLILGGICAKAGQESIIGMMFGLPALASACAWVATLYYILRAVF